MTERAPAVSTRQTLEQRARELATQREAFLADLAGRTPSTAEERAVWAQLVEERQAVEDALERHALEERIASHQARAQDARAAGRTREARGYDSEAAYLRERLAEVHYV